MLSLPKHLYCSSKRVTLAVEMLRQAQHDVLFLIGYFCTTTELVFYSDSRRTFFSS